MTSISLVLAYIDPGSGSFIIQVIAGAVLGASVAVKMYWAQCRNFVAGLLGRKRGGDDVGE